MKNNLTNRAGAAEASAALAPPSLHRYIARTLRVSARHLPWAIVQRIHALSDSQVSDGALSIPAGLPILELEDYNWRLDVTPQSVAATKTPEWHALHRLLTLAQSHRCEGLELAGDNLVLPAVLAFDVFSWP